MFWWDTCIQYHDVCQRNDDLVRNTEEIDHHIRHKAEELEAVQLAKDGALAQLRDAQARMVDLERELADRKDHRIDLLEALHKVRSVSFVYYIAVLVTGVDLFL